MHPDLELGKGEHYGIVWNSNSWISCLSYCHSRRLIHGTYGVGILMGVEVENLLGLIRKRLWDFWSPGIMCYSYGTFDAYNNVWFGGRRHEGLDWWYGFAIIVANISECDISSMWKSLRLDVENNTLDDFFVLRQNTTKPDQDQCHVRLSISILYTVWLKYHYIHTLPS